MYEVSSHNSFSMQSGSNGSLSLGESYDDSSYYGGPSVPILSAAAGNATYGDLLLQPNTACYASAYHTTDESLNVSCKQSYYRQDGAYNSLSMPTRGHDEVQTGGHHPGRSVQTSASASSPSAAAAAAVAEATATLRLATSNSMFALKPSQPTAGAFSFRDPTAEPFAVAARLAAGAAAAVADFVPTSIGLSSGYAQSTTAGFGGMTTSSTCGTADSAYQFSSGPVDDASTSLHSAVHGFHPAANGLLSPSTTSGPQYSAFQKLQTPWTTSRMTMGSYSSLDICKLASRLCPTLLLCTCSKLTVK